MLVRAYAFTGRNKNLLALLLPAYLGLLGANIWAHGTNITRNLYFFQRWERCLSSYVQRHPSGYTPMATAVASAIPSTDQSAPTLA